MAYYDAPWNYIGENVGVVFKLNAEGVPFIIREDKKGRYRDFGRHPVKWRSNFLVAEALVSAWMKSPPHRKNILSPQFRALGAAVEEGVYNTFPSFFGVQVFSNIPKWKENIGNIKIQDRIDRIIIHWEYEGKGAPFLIKVYPEKDPQFLAIPSRREKKLYLLTLPKKIQGAWFLALKIEGIYYPIKEIKP